MLEAFNLIQSLEGHHSIIILMVQLTIALLTYYYNFRYKSWLEKQVEQYKHKLQVEFIKAEVRTKQLFSIYPSLFAHFKALEGELFLLKAVEEKEKKAPHAEEKVPIKRVGNNEHAEEIVNNIDTSASEKEAARDAFVKANNYCMYNLVFLSKEVAALGLELIELFRTCINSKTDIKPEIWDNIKHHIQLLEDQIRKELSSAEKKI